MTPTIFERYPLAEEPVMTSAGPQPTPYHVYDGHLLLIGGHADFHAVQKLLVNEQLHPARTVSDRALMALYIADETKASHGPHTELQCAFYGSHQPTAPVRDSPFAPIHYLITEPLARQLCFMLWNNTPETVAYNREILGLTPRLATSTVERAGGHIRFRFDDVESETLLLQGEVHEAPRQPLDAVGALFRAFGLRQALRAAAMKEVSVTVVNPVSAVIPRNADALTIAAPQQIITQLFDAKKDRLKIPSDSAFGQLDFQPTFAQHMRGFQMVYGNPQ